MSALPSIWFLLVGVLLCGYAILDGFDLGVGILHPVLARNERERRMTLNAIGPVWDGNEVWLLTGGGAIFAAFPNVYATVFSGLYLPLMLVLAGMIVRAVALEFRSKEDHQAWRSTWDWALALASFVPSLLFGVAVGNIMRGLPLSADGEYAGGFFNLLNPFAVSVGLLTVALFLRQGGMWLDVKTTGDLAGRAAVAARGSGVAAIAFWFAAMQISAAESPHLWKNFARFPAAWLAPALFLAGSAAAHLASRRRRAALAFLFSSVSLAALVANMGIGIYPNLVPALHDPAASLSVGNSASSPLTLRTMLILALIGMPIVVGYTIFIYSRFRGPVTIDENSY